MSANHRSGCLRWATIQTFLRHQAASAVATVIDFAVMIALVEGLTFSPTLATALGSLAGALANFLLNRRWTFAVAGGNPWRQGLRYAAVAGSSLGLNVLGVHLLRDVLGLLYIAARVVVSLLVGFFWNFPLHRRFVFPATEA